MQCNGTFLVPRQATIEFLAMRVGPTASRPPSIYFRRHQPSGCRHAKSAGNLEFDVAMRGEPWLDIEFLTAIPANSMADSQEPGRAPTDCRGR